MYRLTIIKFESNEKYEEELEEWKNRRGTAYGTFNETPSREKETRSLSVDLTDEEFAAIKKAVLEVM